MATDRKDERRVRSEQEVGLGGSGAEEDDGTRIRVVESVGINCSGPGPFNCGEVVDSGR